MHTLNARISQDRIMQMPSPSCSSCPSCPIMSAPPWHQFSRARVRLQLNNPTRPWSLVGPNPHPLTKHLPGYSSSNLRLGRVCTQSRQISGLFQGIQLVKVPVRPMPKQRLRADICVLVQGGDGFETAFQRLAFHSVFSRSR